MPYTVQGVGTQGAHNNVVLGNLVGTDVTGKKAIANADGVWITDTNNTVGGTASGSRNVISANTGAGITLSGAGAGSCQVLGNYIGTDITGTAALGNGSGVYDAGTNDTIGGTTASARNVISGNKGNGVQLAGSQAVVAGNYIGVGADGTTAVANSGSGVVVDTTGSNNTIGGTAQVACNTIDNNGTGLSGGYGILLLGNNNFFNWNSVFRNVSGWLDDSGTGNIDGGDNSHG